MYNQVYVYMCVYIYIVITIIFYEKAGERRFYKSSWMMVSCRRVAVSPCRALGGMWHAAMHHSEEQHHKTPRDHDTTLKNRNQGDRCFLTLMMLT